MEQTLIGTPDVVQQIKQLLVTDLQLRVTPEQIPDDYSLMEGGLALDSILIAELIALIEVRFGLQFDERILDGHLFTNLSVLAGFVAREYAAARSNARELQAGEASC